MDLKKEQFKNEAFRAIINAEHAFVFVMKSEGLLVNADRVAEGVDTKLTIYTNDPLALFCSILASIKSDRAMHEVWNEAVRMVNKGSAFAEKTSSKKY